MIDVINRSFKQRINTLFGSPMAQIKFMLRLKALKETIEAW